LSRPQFPVEGHALFYLADVDHFLERGLFPVLGTHGVVELALAADELLDIGVARRPDLVGVPTKMIFPS